MLILLYELPACLPTCKFGHISILWNIQLREFHDSVDQNRMMDQGLSRGFVLAHCWRGVGAGAGGAGVGAGGVRNSQTKVRLGTV